MPFSKETKRGMFERCLRLCCLCLKLCGTKIEAAHIVDEAAGGSNTEENGIPTCFDCHHDIGHYRIEHPKGNKYSPKELCNRRDRVYQLVESGAMHAMLVAERIRQQGGVSISEESLQPPAAAPEAIELLERILAGDPDACRGGKIKLLDPSSRSLLLDRLIAESHRPPIIESLMQIAASELLSPSEKQVIVGRSARRVTISGYIHTKSAFLRLVPVELFAALPGDLRAAFFEDVIASIEGDQFNDVNRLLPSLEKQVGAVPEEMHERFVLALLAQTRSNSWDGAPAARRMLEQLPTNMATAGIGAMDVPYLSLHGYRDEIKSFVLRYQNLAPTELQQILRDYLDSSHRQFAQS